MRSRGGQAGEYRLDVENFGPIETASVALRPLTVFVGPSNTGKSYLAILIYALHRSFAGLRRRMHLGPGPWFGRSGTTANRLEASALASLREWVSKAPGDQVRALPADVSAYVRAELERADGPNLALPQDPNLVLQQEMRRCYGVERLGDLIRRQSASSSIGLVVPRDDAPDGRYHLTLGRSGAGFSGTVSGVDELAADPDDLRDLAGDLVSSDDPNGIDDFDFTPVLAGLTNQSLLQLFRPVFRDAYYLPADRTGVMHSHQVVVSTLVQSATTAGLRPSSNIPMLSGVLADFLSQLIEMSGPPRLGGKKGTDLASRLEKALLDGRVRLNRSETGYPTFAYRPKGWKDDLPLMRASSMVSELAPVVLYLRHVVRPRDVLIIEEPEAHLHPAMQAILARELARLVRVGVRIVMTTHSEWFLEQIGNLVRLSALPEDRRHGLDGADCALRPEEVGAWLFRPPRGAAGSVVGEVTLDAETGLYPTDYDVVSETLYNQSAAIFNREQESGER